MAVVWMLLKGGVQQLTYFDVVWLLLKGQEQKLTHEFGPTAVLKGKSDHLYFRDDMVQLL